MPQKENDKNQFQWCNLQDQDREEIKVTNDDLSIPTVVYHSP